MALLLDTHAFLWFINNDPRLSSTALKRIADPDTRVLVSVVSAWELVIKLGTGSSDSTGRLPICGPKAWLRTDLTCWI